MRIPILAIFFGLSVVAFGDTPADPIPFVATTQNGRFFVAVVPPLSKAPDWHVIIRQPYAALYEPQSDGSFKEIWRINDFYSFNVYLSDDAKFMVAIGPWNVGERPSKEDIALLFYKDGKLIKSFSTADLIDDPKVVRVSVSHYEWQDYSDSRYPRMEGHLFEIKTIDGRIVTFGMDDDNVTINKKPQQDAAANP